MYINAHANKSIIPKTFWAPQENEDIWDSRLYDVDSRWSGTQQRASINQPSLNQNENIQKSKLLNAVKY